MIASEGDGLYCELSVSMGAGYGVITCAFDLRRGGGIVVMK